MKKHSLLLMLLKLFTDIELYIGLLYIVVIRHVFRVVFYCIMSVLQIWQVYLQKPLTNLGQKVASAYPRTTQFF